MNSGIALVTGSTSGIGKATALELARAGYRVLASGRNPQKLAALVQEAAAAGVPLETVVLDVTDQGSIDQASGEVDRLTDGHGLDLLVNNAGYSETCPAEHLTAEVLRRQFETNVFGLVQVTHTFLPAMLRRGRGRIVIIGSIGSHVTIPILGAYHASKYALAALADAFRMETAERGVQVAIIEPAYVKTNFLDTAINVLEHSGGSQGHNAAILPTVRRFDPMGWLPGATPQQVARVVLRAARAERPHARYATSPGGWLLVWLLKLTPPFLTDLVLRAGLRFLQRGGKLTGR
jgi:NAD(P)-dependent dehydrogenase (short-subunit alcohol dehydrogenase family)